MERVEACKYQLAMLEERIEAAKKKGKSRIFVSPIYDELIKEIAKPGVMVQRIQLEDSAVAIDIISWDKEYEKNELEELSVEAEEFTAILAIEKLDL